MLTLTNDLALRFFWFVFGVGQQRRVSAALGRPYGARGRYPPKLSNLGDFRPRGGAS